MKELGIDVLNLLKNFDHLQMIFSIEYCSRLCHTKHSHLF